MVKSDKLYQLLLVEDDPAFAEWIGIILRNSRFPAELTTVQSLAGARDMMAREYFDLVLTDLRLPDGLGLSLLDERPGKAPFIVITSQGSEELAVQSLKRGASDYLVKGELSPGMFPFILQRVLEDWSRIRKKEEAENARDRAEKQLRQTLSQLRFILKSTSACRGETFFGQISRSLALALELKFAGVGWLEARSSSVVRVNSYWNGSGFGDPFEYEIEKTPCDLSIKEGFSSISRNVQREFPDDLMLVEFDIEGYVGMAIRDSHRAPIGVLWVMDDRPIEDIDHVREIMTLFVQRIESEMQVILAERAREKNEKLTEIIINNVVDGIITIDEAGLILSANRAAWKIFGYLEGELVGKSFSILMPEPMRERQKDVLKEYLETGKRKVIGRIVEVMARRKDGSCFPLELSVSEMFVESRRFFTGICRDLTEVRETQQALILAKRQAEEASRAKSEFLSRMSHEFRTPMNAILGFSQLLEMPGSDERLSEQQMDNIHHIVRAGNHLLELINDMLDLAAVESGQVTLNYRKTSILRLLEEIVTMIRPMAGKKEVRLILENRSGDDLMLDTDPVRLKQVLINLVSNAVKYNRPGGRVWLSWQQQGEYCHLVVRDDGVGIPADAQDKIFDPFIRLVSPDVRVEGTGIGLTVSKMLVERMRGRIGFDSLPGQGSIFYVDLPVAHPGRPVAAGEPVEVCRNE